MTGPGRSPSSPWAPSVHGSPREGRTQQGFHPSVSPSMQGGSLSDRPNSNYFGIAVDNTSNPPTSTPGPHVQKNWGAYARPQSSLPSPKLQLYSHESVSEGLVNLLRSETDTDKGRRESALQSRRPSQDNNPNSRNLESKQWSQVYFGGNKLADVRKYAIASSASIGKCLMLET